MLGQKHGLNNVKMEGLWGCDKYIFINFKNKLKNVYKVVLLHRILVHALQRAYPKSHFIINRWEFSKSFS